MILITGGSGYLGGRLAKYLLRFQSKRIVLSTKNKIYTPPEMLSNCEVRFLNVTDEDSITNSFSGVTDVIHLASINAQDSAKNPEEARTVNSEGTGNLVEIAKRHDVKRFIYISTAHIYGSPLEGSIDETTQSKATHPYATSHFAAEKHVLSLLESSSVTPTILRLSNAVGAPISKEANCWMLVINDLVCQVIRKNSMTFSSNKNVRRDFIAIQQVCMVINHILNSNADIYKGVYNLGSGLSISLGDIGQLIADRAKEMLEIQPKIFFDNNPDMQEKELYFSIEKIEREGVRIDNNLEAEIDNLLILSKQWFS